MYIGKAKDLKKRCKNYLTGKDTRPRINKMMESIKWIEVVITPTERDAFHLEAKLINLLQPPFNVCLKDDVSFPYLCASTPLRGDALPQFERVPRKGFKTALDYDHEYFGPFANTIEADKVLQRAETEYELRMLAFKAKNGEDREAARWRYMQNFMDCKAELFELETATERGVSAASPIDLLFDEETNYSRDIVALAPLARKGEVLVRVVQLRKGVHRGSFDYRLTLGESNLIDEEQVEAVHADAIAKALEAHYLDDSKRSSDDYDHKPEAVLTQVPLDATLTRGVKDYLNKGTTVREPRRSGRNKKTDEVAMQFAQDNTIAAVEQINEIMPLTMQQRGVTEKQIKERGKSLKVSGSEELK